MRAGSLLIALLVSGCLASISSGPPRLYSIDEEMTGIRLSLKDFDLVRFNASNDIGRRKYRDDWVTARMYAIDIQYTAYEAALTKERQGVGFGAAVATIGLATASTLVPAVQTKDILTGTAGAITGARAAYENDILFAHSVQWIQTQMRSQRTTVGERIQRGLMQPVTQYTLAAAASDLEDYYRAGTFTGGVLGTTAAVNADAKLAEQLKQDRVEFAFVATAAGQALRRCAVRPGAKARLMQLLPTPPGVNPDAFFFALGSGQSPGVAEDVLARARNQGICP
jgi:hypothetical protein